MEDELETLANQVHQLFQERRLYLYSATIQQLQQLLQALERYKSECTSTIATVKTLLLRKREIEFNQNHSRALEELFYEMVKNSKDKEEGEIYRLWFEKLKRFKSYSFELAEFSLYVVPPRKPKEKEAPERMLQNYEYLENLMKEDSKAYLQLIQILQNQVKYLQMPVEHLRCFAEGIKKHNYHWSFYQLTNMLLAYKVMSNLNVSEKQLRENRQLLEKMYDELVNKNSDGEDADEWRHRFIQLEQKHLDDFTDGAYIRGDDLDRFREQREKSNEASSCEANPLASSERTEGEEGRQSLSVQQNQGQKESHQSD